MYNLIVFILLAPNKLKLLKVYYLIIIAVVRRDKIMTLNELKNKLSSEGHVVGSLYIKCGEKYQSPDVLGIYEEDGVWYVYDTTDRGEIVVLAEGNENDMTEALYRRVLKKEKRYLKKKEWYLKSKVDR